MPFRPQCLRPASIHPPSNGLIDFAGGSGRRRRASLSRRGRSRCCSSRAVARATCARPPSRRASRGGSKTWGQNSISCAKARASAPAAGPQALRAPPVTLAQHRCAAMRKRSAIPSRPPRTHACRSAAPVASRPCTPRATRPLPLPAARQGLLALRAPRKRYPLAAARDAPTATHAARTPRPRAAKEAARGFPSAAPPSSRTPARLADPQDQQPRLHPTVAPRHPRQPFSRPRARKPKARRDLAAPSPSRPPLPRVSSRRRALATPPRGLPPPSPLPAS